MAIKTLEQRKRQNILLVVAGAIFLISFLILYFGFLSGKEGSEELAPPVYIVSEEETQQPSIFLEEKLKRINLDFKFLNEKILPFLKIYGDIPVKKGITGRENPFTP